MAVVAVFTFNPFQENTILVVDETKECVIFDPGCSTPAEKQKLVDYINAEGLRPVRLINTHCHIDHIYGNAFVSKTFDIPLEIHRGELPVLKAAPVSAQMFGIPFQEEVIEPGAFIEEGEVIEFGQTKLKALLTPGHSPASLSFFDEADALLVSGDVLFQGSIGRTDLPGGDYDTLIRSIREQLLPLGDEVLVYPGHGPSTTIGAERRSNPFLQGI